MTNEPFTLPVLRRALEAVAPPTSTDSEDFRIAAPLGRAYLARARTGLPALLIPLESTATTVGRRGGGFVLTPAAAVSFRFDGRSWEQGAATLECTDPALEGTFEVLALDIANRLQTLDAAPGWSAVVSLVDEWQVLLGRRNALTTDQQLGLWGELWIIATATDPDVLVAAWRGPDGDAVDFFLKGLGLEVKTSRRRLVHHVSQTQANEPMGQHDVYFLSLWVGVDPAGVSLADLVEKVLNKIADPPAFTKRLAILGYSPLDRDQYESRLTPLEGPMWFASRDIPGIGHVDEGISQIRYVVSLDPARCLLAEAASGLWSHFCGAASIPQGGGNL